MAQLVVRNLDEDVKSKLQLRARRHGRSTEEEVRDILRNSVKDEGHHRGPGLGTRIAALFAEVGLEPGENIEEQRGQHARPAKLDW